MTQQEGTSSHGWTHDTFVSFRGEDEGEDLRHGFVGNLRHSLQLRGIRVFNDDNGDIRKGENITNTLMEAIEESQTAILVFSKHYATSSFCLRELVHIQKHIKGHHRNIWVVFYNVDPSDVRHQKNSYESAFQRYENERDQKGERKYKEDEVKEWKEALKKAADVCGWHWESSKRILTTISDPYSNASGFVAEEQRQPTQQQKSSFVQLRNNIYEYEVIEEILKAMSNVINDGPLLIARFPIGLKSRVQNVLKLLKQQPGVNGATMVGIWGTGGLGKSTLARAVYNKISKDFIHLCFLADVRKKSIKELAKTLLSKTLMVTGDEFENIDESTISLTIKARLHRKKVLIILDDIDELKQLQALAGEPNWFGFGSQIIITTRNQDLLLKHNIDESRIYNVELLTHDQASELLRLHAFKMKNVDSKYKDVINRAVKYAGRLPLVLEVLGSHLCAHQTPEDWEGILDMYERVPEKTVLETLKVSYDGLEEIQQQIFLDIACFYRGESLEDVTKLLSASHNLPRPESCIRVLIERSLLKIEKNNFVQMHDLIQDMGQEIVKRESTELGKRSRLWSTNNFLHVLETDTGSGRIQAINVVFGRYHEVHWNGEAFKKMTCLRQLIIDSDVPFYERPLQYLPNNLRVQKWKLFSRGPVQYLPNSLRVLKWKFCPLSTLPHDFDPSNLVKLSLTRSKLETLEQPSLNYWCLRDLNVSGCKNLKEIPNMSRAANLEILKVKWCRNLRKIDDSIGHLEKLKIVKAPGCSSLKTFIKGGIKLPSLEILDLSYCSKLEKSPQILEEMENIRELNLRESGIKELPESIEKLVGLECLDLYHCKELCEVPINSISKLRNLQIVNVSCCWRLFTWFKNHSLGSVSLEGYFPNTRLNLNHTLIHNDSLFKLLSLFPNLRVLDLSYSLFTKLPECIKNCHNFIRVSLDNCSELQGVSDIPQNIQVLSAVNCINLTSHSTSRLLSQALHENGRTRFILPGENIPEWFHKQSEGDSTCFSFRNEFPNITVGVVIHFDASLRSRFSLKFDILLNGVHLIIKDPYLLHIRTDHVYLFNLKRQDSFLRLEDEVLKEEWNEVVIKCKRKEEKGKSLYGGVKCIGVYACNYEKCKYDVDWKNTGPSKEAESYQEAMRGGDDKQKMRIIKMDINAEPA